MHLDQELNMSAPDLSLMLLDQSAKAITRFPKSLDSRLSKGLERLIANTSSDFLGTRSYSHLRTLLLAQFLLQKKMETSLNQDETAHKHLFLKIFPRQSRICVALVCTPSFGFMREQVLKAFHTLLPGIREIPGSFYLWYQPDFPYFFCYLEVHKLRGQELTKLELHRIEKILQEQLHTTPPLTQALFWPYNKEESFRQIQLLQREIRSREDLPHVSVHFQEQTPSSLEFLIHIARPKTAEPIDAALKRLPESLHPFCHFQYENKIPFPIEIGAFSIKVPSAAFDLHDSINLLYARRYALKYLESIIGRYRDYNGGLFEKQQEYFEIIRLNLGENILHFDLFAEKLFYALHPVEQWINLSLEKAKELFTAFSELIQHQDPFAIRNSAGSFTIIKTSKSSDLQRLKVNPETKSYSAHAQITIGGFHYLCLLCPGATEIPPLLLSGLPREKVLRLLFQEGPPPSLNPHYSAGDMRCRIISKLLFEGLTRLNDQGKPELAGAKKCAIEGLIYTFKLRPYCWSNGENVTAVDYAASWQYALNDHLSHPELLYTFKNARSFKEKKCTIKEVGIRVLDAETLQVELEKPDPYFLHKLAQPFFFPLFGSLREPKWFNGPYLIREQSQEGILLERNPYFWAAKRPHFEQIDIRMQNSVETTQALFQKGEVDWLGDPLNILSPQQITELKNENKLRKQKVSRRFHIYFNTKHPALCSPLIRRALALSLDRSYICSHIFPDCIPSAPFIQDKEEAKLLFEKGLEQMGLTRETFPPFTFTYSQQTRRGELAAYLQATWREVLGLELKLEEMDWNRFRSNLEKRQFEVCGTIQDTVHEDSLEYLERFEGSNSWNFSQWSHPEYRTILTQAFDATDKNRQKDLMNQAEKILSEEASFSPLFDYVHLYAHSPQLEGYLVDEEGCIDFSWGKFRCLEKL
jgi:oligopeptide transport system substrate-binding protein